MRIVIVNCWHDSNKGDAAITIGLLNALKDAKVWDVIEAVSYILYRTSAELDYGFRHVSEAHPELGLLQTTLPALSRSCGKRLSLWLLIRATLKLIAPHFLPDRDCELSVRNASVVVSSGGLYFGFVKKGFLFNLYHLFAFSYPLLLARRLGVPYVLYAQSFGPFHGAFSRWWMRMLVAGSAATWARESYSRDILLRLGAPPGKIDVVPDAAFGLRIDNGRDPSIPRKYDLENGNYVVISARSLEPSGHASDLEEIYGRSLVSLIDWLTIEKRINVAIVAHTIGPLEDEDDRITSRDLYRAVSANALTHVRLIEDDLSPAKLSELYGSSCLVVATRFHAAVLALGRSAPVIAIPYFGVKTQGYLKDLGLADWMIRVEDLSVAALKSKVLDCLEGGHSLRKATKDLAEEQYRAAIETGERLRQVIDVSAKKSRPRARLQSTERRGG